MLATMLTDVVQNPYLFDSTTHRKESKQIFQLKTISNCSLANWLVFVLYHYIHNIVERKNQSIFLSYRWQVTNKSIWLQMSSQLNLNVQEINWPLFLGSRYNNSDTERNNFFLFKTRFENKNEQQLHSRQPGPYCTWRRHFQNSFINLIMGKINWLLFYKENKLFFFFNFFIQNKLNM